MEQHNKRLSQYISYLSSEGNLVFLDRSEVTIISSLLPLASCHFGQYDGLIGLWDEKYQDKETGTGLRMALNIQDSIKYDRLTKIAQVQYNQRQDVPLTAMKPPTAGA